MTKEKQNELMNRISLALNDATLQQGFEILCKRISVLEKENDCYKALESHYEEIEEDAKAIAKENEELEEIREQQARIIDNDTIRIEKLEGQIEQLSNDNHVLKTSFITQQEQIEELKKVILEQQEHIREVENDSNHCEHWSYIRIKLLEEQIEKMKCCSNCKHKFESRKKGGFTMPCEATEYKPCDRWELAL